MLIPGDTLLDVDDLHVEFTARRQVAAAVRGVSLTVRRGETLGIVGESGSGKSVTALALLRLVAPPGRIARGRIVFDGTDLLTLSETAMRSVRGARIAMVFQDPLTSLNPTMTVGAQIVETILAHRGGGTRAAWREADDLLQQVGISLSQQRLRQYPFELSGGMRQRVMIAIAFSCRPALLIADEPTTALDVTVQAQILDLMDSLRAEHGTSVILITHDLGVVAERCDSVAVMYAGQIVEYGESRTLFDSPRHPYTKALLASLSDWRHKRSIDPLPALPGQPPGLGEIPAGCAFADRCPVALPACSARIPALTFLEGTEGKVHTVRCVRSEPNA
ncbi:MAG: ABC transporter ATP-binding protein [Capsulimonadaceae bacterium]